LQHIFDSWDQSFILPPINRSLLPHHRAQRFRSVTLTPRNYHAFEAAVHSNGVLRGLVQFFNLEVASWTNHRSFHRLPLPRELSSFLASLPDLKQISLRLAPGSGEPLLCPSNHFTLNPTLEYLIAKPFVSDQDLGEKWRNVFDTKQTRKVRDEWGLRRLFDKLCFDIGEPVVFELKRQKRSSTYSLRYCTREILSHDLRNALERYQIRRLHLVMLRASSTLNQILSTLANPSSLTHLDITLVALTAGAPLLGPDALRTFTNLTHLALSGAIFPTSTEFYKTLQQFPLRSLHFGPNLDVDIKALTELLTDQTESNRINLDQLVLDNIDAKVPAEEEEADLKDWVVPDWTETCTKEGVEKLRMVAKGLGIEIAGSTFLGVDIEDSEAYQEALERAQDAEQSGSENVDGAEDEDENEDKDSDEYESEMEEREQEADMESDHHESEHEAECGYDQSWGFFRRYADLRGFRSRRY